MTRIFSVFSAVVLTLALLTVVAFAGITEPDAVVLKLASTQPEFTSTTGEYLAKAVTPIRIDTGQQKLSEHGKLLKAIEAKYVAWLDTGDDVLHTNPEQKPVARTPIRTSFSTERLAHDYSMFNLVLPQ